MQLNKVNCSSIDCHTGLKFWGRNKHWKGILLCNNKVSQSCELNKQTNAPLEVNRKNIVSYSVLKFDQHHFRCSRQTTPPPTLSWRSRTTPPKVILGNPKNYRKPKFQLFVHFLSKPKQGVTVLKIKYAFNVSYNSEMLQTNHKC